MLKCNLKVTNWQNCRNILWGADFQQKLTFLIEECFTYKRFIRCQKKTWYMKLPKLYKKVYRFSTSTWKTFKRIMLSRERHFVPASTRISQCWQLVWFWGQHQLLHLSSRHWWRSWLLGCFEFHIGLQLKDYHQYSIWSTWASHRIPLTVHQLLDGSYGMAHTMEPKTQPEQAHQPWGQVIAK